MGLVMRRLSVSLAITIAAVGAAHAADLPTKKDVPPPPPVNCFGSLWDYLNSTAADCPLTYGPVTAYLTLDWGVGWEFHGAGYNAAFNNGVSNIVTKQSSPHSEWLQTPNGINQSVVGLKISQPMLTAGRSSARRRWASIPIGAIWPTLSARRCRTTAKRSFSRMRTPIQAAPANGITRKASSASATRPTGR